MELLEIIIGRSSFEAGNTPAETELQTGFVNVSVNQIKFDAGITSSCNGIRQCAVDIRLFAVLMTEISSFFFFFSLVSFAGIEIGLCR